MIHSHRFRVNSLWLLILFTLPLPLLFAIYQELPSLYQGDKLGINASLIAYTWMLAAIYLATKPKWLDKRIGLPDMYLVHGMLSIFGLHLAWLHKYLSPSAGWIKTSGDFSLYVFTGLIVYSLFFLGGWFTSRVKIAAFIKKSLEKIFKHEVSVWLHRLNIVATLVVYIHVWLIDYLRTLPLFFFLLTLYTILTFASYAWYLLITNRSLMPGVIKEISFVAPTILEVVIKAPRSSLKQVQSGDFNFLSFPQIQGLKEPHPFSVANDPRQAGLIKLLIETVGDYTQQLANVTSNTPVTFSKGYGVLHDMIKETQPAQEIVLLGGGIGVVPFFSILSEFKEKTMYFFYSIKKEKEFLESELLETWDQAQNWTLFLQKGRFTEDQLKEHVPLHKDAIYLIAGPMAMNLAYEAFLIDHGITKEQIYYESFSW
ncbi:ferredoxin reductase family protein [Enterococcus bulliens]